MVFIQQGVHIVQLFWTFIENYLEKITNYLRST